MEFMIDCRYGLRSPAGAGQIHTRFAARQHNIPHVFRRSSGRSHKHREMAEIKKPALPQIIP
jgi:hypothetical protein